VDTIKLDRIVPKYFDVSLLIMLPVHDTLPPPLPDVAVGLKHSSSDFFHETWLDCGWRNSCLRGGVSFTLSVEQPVLQFAQVKEIIPLFETELPSSGFTTS
jgi:hypothetical protein